MDKKLITSKLTKIEVKYNLMIDRKYMTEVTNDAGVKMLKYKYQIMITQEKDYNISDPQEYIRIAKALNSPNVRFVKINNDLVNINTIRILKEKVGYISLKELENQRAKKILAKEK